MYPMPPAYPKRRRGREQGIITLELAVLAPLLILMTFAVVQAALTGYAKALARVAAHAGVSEERSVGASVGAGVARARAVLAEEAADTVKDAAVSDAGSTPYTVRLTVSGRSLSVIPGLPGIGVSATAQAPRERFTGPGAP